MTLLYGMLVGLALGLTGGGGSIFAVPLLIYGLGVATHEAIGVSLVTVAITSAFGAVGALRAGLVEYRAGAIFALAGMAMAPLGVTLAQRVPAPTITLAFAALMIVVAAVMWWRATRYPQMASIVRSDVGTDIQGGKPMCRFNPDAKLTMTWRCGGALTLAGVGTGLLSGFFGVGGGFLIVPALTFVTRMGVHRAVATSLFVIVLVGGAGAGAVSVTGSALPWTLTAEFVAGGVAGMLLGRVMAHRIAGPALQKTFAALLWALALYVLFVGRLSPA